MNRKLNYIFSQVIDNYKTAYKGNRPFYIGFGLLFVVINAIVFVTINAFGFLVFNQNPQHNTEYLLFSYLLLLILPCLATLRKEEEEALSFWKTLNRNSGMLIIIGGLATIGFFFLENTSESFNSLDGIVTMLSNLLTIFILLFVLRNSLKKTIPLLDLLMETVILTILLYAIIKEFISFFSYGFLESFGFIFKTDFGEIFLTPILFVAVNLLLSPLLVCIITTVIRYENTEERIIETTDNEAF